VAFISLGIKSQTFWCDVESLFCTQKKPVMKKLQQFGQFSAGHFSIIVKIAVGSRLFFDGSIFKFDLKKIQKRFNLSWCISISVGCYFFICLSFFWGSYGFYWCSILFLGEEISHGRPNPGSPLLGGTCAAFAGTNGWSWAMPRGPEMGSYGRLLIWVNYNDLTATEPWNHG